MAEQPGPKVFAPASLIASVEADDELMSEGEDDDIELLLSEAEPPSESLPPQAATLSERASAAARPVERRIVVFMAVAFRELR
jgi:hypothetical protein